MASTAVYGLPYPTLTDAPNGPAQFQALAEKVEAELSRIDNLVTVLTSPIQSLSVPTAQATSSGEFTDLATVGPSVSKQTGNSALVIVSCFVFNGTANAVSTMGYEVSGATTAAASDSSALRFHSTIVNGQGRMSAVYHHVGLNAGFNTFTAKYKVNSGSGTFSDRQLVVLSL